MLLPPRLIRTLRRRPRYQKRNVCHGVRVLYDIHLLFHIDVGVVVVVVVINQSPFSVDKVTRIQSQILHLRLHRLHRYARSALDGLKSTAESVAETVFEWITMYVSCHIEIVWLIHVVCSVFVPSLVRKSASNTECTLHTETL